MIFWFGPFVILTRKHFEREYFALMQHSCDENHLGSYQELDLEQPNVNCLKHTAIILEILNRRIFGQRQP